LLFGWREKQTKGFAGEIVAVFIVPFQLKLDNETSKNAGENNVLQNSGFSPKKVRIIYNCFRFLGEKMDYSNNLGKIRAF
jgi:hypothetical protein